MDDALKTQFLDEVEEPYVSELRNHYTGYMGVTTRYLLDHLMDRYGNITSNDLKANEARINEALDNSIPIDVFFQRIDDAVQYADDGKNPFTAKQILQTAFHSVNATGLYREACKEWRQKSDQDKTWTNFKRHFAAEYHEIREQQRVSGDAGFNSANHAHETTDMATALENLALAATADQNIVTDLIATNRRLFEANTTLATQVKSLVATNALLTATQGAATMNKMHNATTKSEKLPINPSGYCWSHGYKVRQGHTSKTCGGKLQGHQEEATRTNTLGGKMWNKPSN